MPGLYLLALCVAIFCLGLIDRRYDLVFFKNRRIACKVIGICVLVFGLWDIAGIVLGIFFIGQTDLLLGLGVGSFPIEEVFFLVLLNYTALVVSQFLKIKRGLA